MKYVCQACGFVYDEELGDPERGIAPGTKFEDLPEDYTCAWCGAGKDMFAAQQSIKKPYISTLGIAWAFLYYFLIYTEKRVNLMFF